MITAFLTTVFFSISAISATRLAHLLGGVAANFWRILLATIFLAVLTMSVGSGFGGTPLLTFFWSGLVGFGIGDLALYQALPRLGSRLSVLLVHCLAAPFGALIEWVWLGTVLDALQLLFGATTLIGVALALAQPNRSVPIGGEWWTGLCCGILAGLGQGGGAVLSRKAYVLARDSQMDVSGFTAAFERILGGLIIAGAAYFFWRWKVANTIREQGIAGSPKECRIIAPWLVLNSISGPVLGVACYQHALRYVPTGVVLPIVALTPLVILPFSMHIEGERPTLRSILGGVIAVGGVIGLLWARSRHFTG